MNILFLSPGNLADYQCDMLLHGLKSLYGDSIVDYPRVPYMYSDYGDVSKLYGRGFTLYKLLPSDAACDRTAIEARIAAHFFDLVIYGSIQRSTNLLSLVTKYYARHKILFIDGEDWASALYGLTPFGLYLKRELYTPYPGVYPIHFAIPASKINTQRSVPKDRVRATIDPRDRSTYTYITEHEYYADYARSLFAFTMKKGGWETLRTLEILANGCIPLFLDLDQCPESTCIALPKPELLEALSLIERDGTYWDTEEGHVQWLSLYRRIHLKFSARCTTTQLAQYVINIYREAA